MSYKPEPVVMPLVSESEMLRLMAHVHMTDTCWLWSGAITDRGYGNMQHRDKTVGVHRLSYMYHKGFIPVGVVVMHKCDTRNCVNPSHLMLGTHKDNQEDKAKKGRSTHGESNPSAKLTAQQVKAARNCHYHGDTVQQLAKRYGVSVRAMEDVVYRSSWKRIK